MRAGVSNRPYTLDAHRATRSSRVIATGGRSTSGQERALGTRSGGLDERLAELLSALGACTHKCG